MDASTPIESGLYASSSPRYGSRKSKKQNRLIATVVAAIFTLHIFVQIGYIISVKYRKLSNYQMNSYEKWAVSDNGYTVLGISVVGLFLTIAIFKPYKLYTTHFGSIY